MKVILLEDVKGVGKAGAVKDVKNGYGFNFLLPEGLAEMATPGALKQAEKIIAKRAKEVEGAIGDWKAKAKELSGKKVTITTKAEKGKLFGSIGREEVAAALTGLGIAVDPAIIDLEKPWKEVGVFPTTARFGHDIEAKFEVSIVAE